MTDRLLSSTRVAELLGVAPSTVKRWADEGSLACERTVGGHRRFRVAEIERFQRRDAALDVADLSGLTKSQRDALPFGLIGVDNQGVVTHYNASEAKFSGISPDKVMGRNFFTDVAPCTNNGLIYGVFRKGVAEGKLDVKIPYTFTYIMQPTNVLIHMVRCQKTHQNWIVVHHKIAG